MQLSALPGGDDQDAAPVQARVQEGDPGVRGGRHRAGPQGPGQQLRQLQPIWDRDHASEVGTVKLFFFRANPNALYSTVKLI